MEKTIFKQRKSPSSIILSEDEQHLLLFLKNIFNEINQTNQISLFVGLLSSTTDSALYWSLSFQSCDILTRWLGLGFYAKYAFKTIVSLSSICAVSAIDIYAAKGMVEQAQYILKRKKILPRHFNFLIKIFPVLIFINGLAVIGPAGLIYTQFLNNKSKAIYFAVAESIVNLLAGSFFMLNMVEEIKRIFIVENETRAQNKKEINQFIGDIISFLLSLDAEKYSAIMSAIYCALEENDLHGLIDILALSTIHNTNDSTISVHSPLITPQVDYKKFLASSTLALFAMFNIAWLYCCVGLLNILTLMPTSDTGGLNIFRYISALAYAVMYGSIAFYSGFILANEITMIKTHAFTKKNILLNTCFFIVASLAALIVISLVHQSINKGKNYLYFGAFIATFIINFNAIRQIDPREFYVDFLYDWKIFHANVKNVLDKKNDGLLNQPTTFFPSQAELTGKTCKLRHQLEFSPDADLEKLKKATRLHKM
ncbi:MAG: hypothetical protein V4496_00040 [Pseudomonadota bacterium]